MARSYVIQKGDTLEKIAKKFYEDSKLYTKLADFNGIRNPDLIMIGQTIEIPSRRELEGKIIEPPLQELIPPIGLEQIITTFGNILDFIREDGILNPLWESEHLTSVPLPFPILLSWDHSKSVTKLYCHKKLSEIFSEVFAVIEREGVRDKIMTFGGCFNFRSKRTSGKLSTHCWGIAIDLNPETNPQGKSGDMHPDVVKIFQQFGFKWGGEWTGRSKDPMHFQFCAGY